MSLPSPIPSTQAEPPSNGDPKPKLWHAGTLVYTQSGLAVLFAWLLWGDFAWSIRDRVVVTVLQLVLRSHEVSDFVAGLLIGTLPAILGVLIGPVVCFKSDRYRGPRGRRIPFLLTAAPVAAISIIGFGFSPLCGKLLHEALGTFSPGYNASVVLVLAFWWMIFDVANAILNSIFGALICDVVPTPVIGRFYGFFRAVSLIVGIAFTTWVLGRAEEYFAGLFITVGVIYGVGVVSMCLKVKEGEYPPPPHVVARHGLPGALESIKLFFKQSFSIPYYVWYFFASNLGPLTFAPIYIYIVFYAKSLGISMTAYGGYLSVSFAISFVLTFFLGSLADRFHPLRMVIVTLALYAATVLWAYFFVSSASFGVITVLLNVLSGAYYTGAASLNQRLLPALIFAELSSASGLINALLYAVAPLIFGAILDYSGHCYQLIFLMALVIAALSVASFAVVYRYWQKYGGPSHYVAPMIEG